MIKTRLHLLHILQQVQLTHPPVRATTLHHPRNNHLAGVFLREGSIGWIEGISLLKICTIIFSWNVSFILGGGFPFFHQYTIRGNGLGMGEHFCRFTTSKKSTINNLNQKSVVCHFWKLLYRVLSPCLSVSFLTVVILIPPSHAFLHCIHHSYRQKSTFYCWIPWSWMGLEKTACMLHILAEY